MLCKLFGDTVTVLIGANLGKLSHVGIDGNKPPKRMALTTEPDALSMKYK